MWEGIEKGREDQEKDKWRIRGIKRQRKRKRRESRGTRWRVKNPRGHWQSNQPDCHEGQAPASCHHSQFLLFSGLFQRIPTLSEP